ncbi:MAG: succinyl-CoA--3-ketoacid-CoA transferase [Clostridiales bacterium]|nr:succinyl-CoA--3-ketoacid-CoA transferase [Clostridiales bacterium]
MSNDDIKQRIAARVADEIKDGDVVGLGPGLPHLVESYIDKDKNLVFKENDRVIINTADQYILVLGALEIDEEANLSTSVDPEDQTALRLVAGAKKVIVATTHTTPEGKPKLLRNCTFPLTVKGKIDLIVTEMAVIEVKDRKLILKEIANGFTVEDILRNTEATIIISDNLKAN